MPKVTVALPVHNDAPYIREAVDSILAQTYRDFALLVVDDGSTDATPDILASYADPRLRVLRLPKNKGRPFARNTALDAADGVYLAWMDGDDVALPHRLAAQVAFMDVRPELAVSGSAVRHFQELRGVRRFPPNYPAIRALSLYCCAFNQCAACFRLDPIRRAGLRYAEAFARAEDYDFCCRLLYDTRLRVANQPDVLLRYRTFPRPSTLRYHREIIRANMGRLGLLPTERELDLHTGLFYTHPTELLARHPVSEVLAWTDKILEANRARPLVDQTLLAGYLRAAAENVLRFARPFYPALNAYHTSVTGRGLTSGRRLRFAVWAVLRAWYRRLKRLAG